MNRRKFLETGLEGIVLISVPLISSCEKNPVNPGNESQNILTLDDLYKNNITNYINQKIFLKTKIEWGYGEDKIEDPTIPIDEIQIGICGFPLRVVFDNIDKYVERKKYLRNPGNFHIVSDKLIKIRDSNDKEQYSFKDKILSNNNEFYILEGMLKYRETIKIIELDLLNNPTFIEQSNSPIYWSQTFKFELVNIHEISKWKSQ